MTIDKRHCIWRICLFLLSLGISMMMAACNPLITRPMVQPKLGEEIAVITELTGQVTLQTVNGAAVASPFQVLTAGSRLQLAPNAGVTIVCFQERIFVLNQPGETEITPERCAKGIPLVANSAQSVKPDAGQLQVYASSFALEEPAREKEADYGSLPIILSPRNTSLLDLKPIVQWVAVEGAIEYQLSLSGMTAFDDIVLDAEKVNCTTTPDVTGSRICTTHWPDSWTLELGRRYFLTINARTGIAAPLRPSTAGALRTLPAEEMQAIQTEATSIQALQVAITTRTALLAGLYARHQLYAAAIPAYTQVVATQPAPLLYIALGDLYRAVDLQRYAFSAYQQALDLLAKGKDDPALRAASEFGIGQVYYARQNYTEAGKHFELAVVRYEQLGLKQAWQAAQAALHEAKSRQ